MKKLMIMGIAVMMVVFGSLQARAAVTMNEIAPINQTVLIPCTGDQLDLTGELHTLAVSTTSKSGMMHTEFHFQPVNVSAVGNPSGDTYRAVGLTRQDATIDTNDGFPVITTFVNNFYIIGVKGGTKYKVHTTTQITINANGEVTADINKTSIVCE